ncbi:metallophosphoesterase [Shimia sp. R9_3]|uniref:metallophosphoesterase n=1 Tax=Shimia sp. R9_3 TaxID=2821113 RepID=UPI001ADC9887|nr:metallophosphoesterase [Shimia sp. R9_3]
MTKIIWMTDPHFQNSGTIDGLDPRKRLEAAISHANTHHADASFAILSGDLVGDDVEGDYAALAEYLSRSELQIYPMMGNNDEREGFRAHLFLPESTATDFIQFTLETEDGTIVCLDTHKIGSHAGEFCLARQNWLEAVLKAKAGRPVYLFMHHPPMALGLPSQDEIMLEDDEAFWDLIGRHSNVNYVFMGHVHRPVCGTIRGIPFATLGALSFQAPAPRPSWSWDSFKPPKEAPQYGVLEISGGSVTLQYTQFCEYSLGMSE